MTGNRARKARGVGCSIPQCIAQHMRKGISVVVAKKPLGRSDLFLTKGTWVVAS